MGEKTGLKFTVVHLSLNHICTRKGYKMEAGETREQCVF